MIFSANDAVEMQFAPEATSPDQACDFVRRYLTQHELSYLEDDVCRVVSELVTNAVAHAREPIRVRLEEMPFCLKLTVYDESVDVSVLKLATRAATGDEGERGSWIIDECTADWGTDLVDPEGKCTWALFAVQPKSSWVHEI